MDLLKNSDFWVSLSALGYGLAYPLAVVLAFTGYAILFGVIPGFIILAVYFHKEAERRLLLLTGSTLFFVNFLPIGWFVSVPIAALLSYPLLRFFDENCLKD